MRMRPTLPPTAAPLPLQGLVDGYAALLRRRGHVARITQEMRDAFGVDHVFLAASGKVALTLILRGLAKLTGRQKVIIPAYTCYSVPSSVVNAGLNIVPCDIDPGRLDFNFDRLSHLVDDQTLCVLTTHLFGMSAQVDRVREICRPRGCMVVEDAAQAMGGTSAGRQVGTIGDVGFFSLGRGKNLSAGGGGVILTRDRAIGEAIGAEYALLPEESIKDSVRNLTELAIMSIFISPRLYWIPAGMPFLGLGETRFYREFPMRRMGESRAATLHDWKARVNLANERRREQAQAYRQELAEFPYVTVVSAAESVYLRLPVLVRDRETKERLLYQATAMGLGITPGYPGTVWQVPELVGVLPEGESIGARTVVERLITLPTHCFVTKEDRRMIRGLFEQTACIPPENTSPSVPSPQTQERRHLVSNL